DAIAATEEARQAGMGHVDMQPVGVIVGDILPVDRARPEGHPTLGHQLLHAVGRQLVRVRGCHFLDRWQARGKADEDEAEEDFLLYRDETMAAHVQALERLALWDSHEAAVEPIGPGMVRTGDSTPAMPLGIVQEPRGAGAPGVV